MILVWIFDKDTGFPWFSRVPQTLVSKCYSTGIHSKIHSPSSIPFFSPSFSSCCSPCSSTREVPWRKPWCDLAPNVVESRQRSVSADLAHLKKRDIWFFFCLSTSALQSRLIWPQPVLRNRADAPQLCSSIRACTILWHNLRFQSTLSAASLLFPPPRICCNI